ncbi:MAG: LysM peptidoglycan-binding domain-containing protein [Bacilli bacterium]|nr:LysM peptidoglycan-binding domain-containing protein [Bacilli bacterium]
MNYKIVLDAGHGGDDPGATGNGIIEKNLTLDITKYLYDRFRDLGIPVKVTRLTDETITPTERVNRVLNAYGNSNDVIVISSHINAGGGDGAEVIYPLRNNNVLPNLILNEMSKEGQNIRGSYQRRLPSNTSKDYYFMQRNTGNTQSLTVEYGFLDSTKDDVNQLKNNYKNLAEAVVRAVTSYIGVPYTPISGDNTYIIKGGDTLYSLARQFNTTVDELKSLNNLTSDVLSVGTIIKIPSGTTPTPDSNTYIVKKGDTLYSIAKNNNTDVNTLKSLNNLTSNTVSIGQVLTLPGAVVIPSTENQYVVKRGDALYSIARKYGISVNDLLTYNNLTSNSLSVGQILNIPIENTNTYTVKSGDTLYGIARQFNTTVDSIKSKNNLSNNILTIGQILTI